MRSGALSCGSHPSRRTHRFAPLVVSVLTAAALGCREGAESPTGPEPAPALATSSTQPLSFRQVSTADGGHTCGVTTDDRAYCWGANHSGQVGDGTTTHRLRPVALAGTLRFRQVSTGTYHSCGVTTDRRAYCWGENLYGQVGDGTTMGRLTPVPVAGGRRFRQVDAGRATTCSVSYPDNRAYCWGVNAVGQLGDGTTTGRLTPGPVAGGHQFRQVGTGLHHTCGVTTSDKVFCWGSNQDGQVGDGSPRSTRRLSPVLVAGGHRFRQVDAAYDHSCAVTTGDRAFCWGNGHLGQIGDGKMLLRFTPRAVAGDLRFTRVSTGTAATCGETAANRAYCWGLNDHGQTGDGTTEITRDKPVPVAGGLTFSQVSASGSHTCGVTPAGVGYCWGGNLDGSLGDGTTTTRLTPVPIVGPM